MVNQESDGRIIEAGKLLEQGITCGSYLVPKLLLPQCTSTRPCLKLLAGVGQDFTFNIGCPYC